MKILLINAIMKLVTYSLHIYFNPSNAEATSIQRIRMQLIWKPPKPYHVGIHWIALAKDSQVRTNVPGFQSFLLDNLATSSIRVNHSFILILQSLIPEFIALSSGQFGNYMATSQLIILAENFRVFRILRSLKMVTRFRQVRLIALAVAKAFRVFKNLLNDCVCINLKK